MDDYRWLRLAWQKADEYQAAAERHALTKSHRLEGAETRPARPKFRKELAKALFRFARTLSPNVATGAEVGKKG